MKRIHYLLLGLLVSLTIAAVSPELPPTRIAPGTNITVVTNGVNSFTLSASGGSSALNQNQFDTTSTNIKSGALVTNLNVNTSITNSGYIRSGDGSSSAPTYSFTTVTNYGLYYSGFGQMGFAVAGLPTIGIVAAGLNMWTSAVQWGTGFGGTVDTAFRRNAAGVVEADSGTTGLSNRITILAGKFTGRAGTSTSPFNAAGVIWVDTTTTGNVGSGVDTILTNNFGANVFTANGDSVDLQISGTYANTAGNTKQLILKVGGQTVYDSGAIAPSIGVEWRMQATLTRTGASALDYNLVFIPSDAATSGVPVNGYNGSITVGLTTNNPVLLTGESGVTPTTDDVVRRIARAEFKPAP